jgi:proteasome assembly chaperone (PAC2) family protein
MNSCSGNDGVLTESAVEKALKKSDFLTKDAQLTKFQTGYYEVSREQLDLLAKLKAAKMITLRAEEKTEIKRTYWAVESIGHYFVAVELTEEGKKYERDEHKQYRFGSATFVRYEDLGWRANDVKFD